MTPENRLILLLARGKLSNCVQEQACVTLEKPLNEHRAWSEEERATPLDWNSILGLVTAEEVYPLFYRNLQVAGHEGGEQGAGSGEQGARGISDCGNRNADWRGADGNADCEFPVAEAAVGRQRSSISGRSSSVVGRGSSVTGPQSVLEQLGGLAKINAFRNALLTEELVRVLRILSEAGIPAIPLKGPALAQQLYGDPSLRVCVDLDILVPRSMVQRAFDLLRSDGYNSEFGQGFFADLLFRHDIEYALRRPARGLDLMVELHWGVMWGGKAEESVTDQLWADAYPTTVFGAPAYALSPEWLILVLAAHAARHQWQGLKWLVDLHELYSAPKFDWDKLDRKAKQLGWQEILCISFLACHKLFETPIPKQYLTGELPLWVKLFPERAAEHLNGAFFATRLIRKPLDKIRYAARVLLIPTLAELRLVALPGFLAFLYYPLRPLRLGWKWVLGIRC